MEQIKVNVILMVFCRDNDRQFYYHYWACQQSHFHICLRFQFLRNRAKLVLSDLICMIPKRIDTYGVCETWLKSEGIVVRLGKFYSYLQSHTTTKILSYNVMGECNSRLNI